MGVCSRTNFMASRNCLNLPSTFSMVSLELVISLRSQGQAPGVSLLISRGVECHSNAGEGQGRMGVGAQRQTVCTTLKSL